MPIVYPNEKKLFNIALVLAVIIWAALIIGTLGILLIYIGIFALIGIFVQSGFISHVKGSGVKITAEQFPDIHSQLLACCEKVGLEEVPDTYLLRTDFFNALATRFLRRHYIVLFTDVVDALQDNPDALNFYIGHEIGHIQRNHIRWGWVLAPVLWLPVLGSAYRRAEEYTCDRYGNVCCDTDAGAIAAISAIVAGDSRWKTMNVDAYLEQVSITGGFFMSLNELTADYPWLSKRMAWTIALRNNTEPELPSRHPLAWFLSLFIPSVPGGLLPLMLVAAFIGILAAVALPAYQSYVETSEALATLEEAPSQAADQDLSTTLSELGPVQASINEFISTNNSYPGDLTEMGYAQSVQADSNGVTYAVYDGGIIGIDMGANAEGDIYLVLEPTINEAGEIVWICYGQNTGTTILPTGCE